MQDEQKAIKESLLLCHIDEGWQRKRNLSNWRNNKISIDLITSLSAVFLIDADINYFHAARITHTPQVKPMVFGGDLSTC